MADNGQQEIQARFNKVGTVIEDSVDTGDYNMHITFVTNSIKGNAKPHITVCEKGVNRANRQWAKWTNFNITGIVSRNGNIEPEGAFEPAMIAEVEDRVSMPAEAKKLWKDNIADYKEKFAASFSKVFKENKAFKDAVTAEFGKYVKVEKE